MIALTDHSEGVLLPVRAQPGARKSGVLGEQAGALKLAATAPADEGRANAALIELISELFGLKRSQVELVSGAKVRNKKVLIRGVNTAVISSRLSDLVRDASKKR